MNQPPAPVDGGHAMAPTARVRHLPLHAHAILKHAAAVHGEATVTSVPLAGSVSRITYAQLADRSQRYAAKLKSMGVGLGEPVVNMGLSSAEQLAWLYAALRVGAITHLMNPLLAPEQVLQLIAAAKPSLLLHDEATAALADAVPGLVPAIPHLNMAAAQDPSAWSPPWSDDLAFAEDAAAMVCYSSGTTGCPKAVQYSHRSTVLHAWGCALPDAMGVRAQDRVLPLMQTFHATAWGAPFVCPLVGASLILVPPSRDPRQWYEWIEEHEATLLGAVTSHWMALAQYMQANKLRFSKLQRTVVGGTRMPEALAQAIAEGLGLEVRHAWGMTETSPLATVERYAPGARTLRHGKPVFGVELRMGDGQTLSVRTAGKHLNELHVRGHWVAHRSDDAWLPTGDWAALHADGHLEVIDRLQDALGGAASLVSSAVVEFQVRLLAGVADAALVRLDSKESVLAWVAQPQADAAQLPRLMRQMLAEHFNGWMPDHVMAVDALPYTHSAKVQKHLLKPQLAKLIQPSTTRL